MKFVDDMRLALANGNGYAALTLFCHFPFCSANSRDRSEDSVLKKALPILGDRVHTLQQSQGSLLMGLQRVEKTVLEVKDSVAESRQSLTRTLVCFFRFCHFVLFSQAVSLRKQLDTACSTVTAEPPLPCHLQVQMLVPPYRSPSGAMKTLFTDSQTFRQSRMFGKNTTRVLTQALVS